MSANKFHAHVLELIRRTSAFLPPDVTQVLEMHRALEQQGSKASLALDLVSQNIGLAKRLSAPICQDTGTITIHAYSIDTAGQHSDEVTEDVKVRAAKTPTPAPTATPTPAH